MLNSPLKTVVDKIKPVKSKSTVSSLRFERSSDFKKFIRFIKDETEELEKIKLPTKSDVEPKSKTPVLGLFGIAAFAGLLALFGGDKNKKTKEPFVSFEGGSKLAVQSSVMGTKIRKPIEKFRTDPKTKKQFKKEKGQIIFNSKKRLKKIFNKIVNRVVDPRTGERLSLKKFLKSNKLSLKTLFGERRQLRKNMDRLSMERVSMADAEYFRSIVKLQNIEVRIRELLTERKILGRKIKFNNLTVSAIREMMDDSKLPGDVGSKALNELELLREADPRFKTVIEKEIGKIDPLAFNPKKIPTFKIPFFKDKRGANFTFTPRDFLSKQFKTIGKKTKGFRVGVSSIAKKTPLLGSSIRFLRSPIVQGGLSKLNFALLAGGFVYDIGDQLIAGDTIFHEFYNSFVRFNNESGAGSKDPSKLRLFRGKKTGLPQEKLDIINATRDRKNQEILKRRNAAIEANKNSNNSDIIPFSTGGNDQDLSGIIISPSNTTSKFTASKLNKQ